MKRQEFLVCENEGLVDFLRGRGIAKNKVKTYVRLGFLMVNDQVVSKLPYVVFPNDKVVIDEVRGIDDGFRIVYEDESYLIVDKRAGLLTISTDTINKEKEVTLYRMVREYLNKKKEYAFIVNRIDKETSGLVIFVKNEVLKKELQKSWNEIVQKRGYVAIVSGRITKEGRIDNYLYEDKRTFSHSTKVGGKRAITNYKPIKDNGKYTMLDVAIETGRKNQIRVHLMEMGYPIVGDKKYGSKDNSLKRLALHHYEISLMDPITHQLLSFVSEVPGEFYDLFC